VPIKLLILVCVYLAGYGTALSIKKPVKPLESSSASHKIDEDTEIVKETFSCPNGALSSREVAKSKKKEASVTASAQTPAPQTIPDNLIFTAGTNLNIGVLLDISDLPLIPRGTWVGYERGLKNDENVYKLGYSTRIF